MFSWRNKKKYPTIHSYLSYDCISHIPKDPFSHGAAYLSQETLMVIVSGNRCHGTKLRTSPEVYIYRFLCYNTFVHMVPIFTKQKRTFRGAPWLQTKPFFNISMMIVSSFSTKTYVVDTERGVSNEYSQHMFS